MYNIITHIVFRPYKKTLCIIFYKLCTAVCTDFINLYIKLLMFYDILGFIDGPRPDANGTADDTQ